MRRVLAVGVVAAALVVWQVPRSTASGDLATVWFFDVGQGDAALVGTPAGHQVLIDGGPDDSVLHGLGKAMPFGDKTIDAVMVSHQHADHYRGLQSVFERYKVAVLLVSTGPQGSPEYQRLLDTAAGQGTVVKQVTAKASLAIPQAGAAEVLFPLEPSEGKLKHAHDAMLVARVTVGSTAVLFSGDAEKIAENAMVGVGQPLDSDILKAGHHGSKTSSQPSYLAAVTPQASIVSVGADNRYRHPSPQAIQALEAVGEVYRTDQRGTVKVRIGPAGYRISTER